MSAFVRGLLAGLGAGAWVIGFVAVLGGLLLILITIWAVCISVLELCERVKEDENDDDNDD